MSAQPVHQETDPRDPKVIHDRLPRRQRPVFLHEYRAALAEAHGDLARYSTLQQVLSRWHLISEAESDPGYHEALADARSATTAGLSIEELDAIRHPA